MVSAPVTSTSIPCRSGTPDAANASRHMRHGITEEPSQMVKYTPL